MSSLAKRCPCKKTEVLAIFLQELRSPFYLTRTVHHAPLTDCRSNRTSYRTDRTEIDLGSVSDRFGPFRNHFRTVSNRFGPFSDRFGRFRIVFGPFRMVSDRFRTVSDDFGSFSDDSALHLKFQISIGQGWGPSEPSCPSEPSGPNPGQLKFKILTKNRKANGKKPNRPNRSK